MYFLKSVKSKLFISLLIVSIIPLILISSILFYKVNTGVNTLLKDNQNAMKASITNQFNQISNELLELSKLYAKNPEVIEFYRDGNREQLEKELEPIFTRLQAEHHVDVLELGGEDGKVDFRAHNPEKFGDDKSDKPAIPSALNGNELSGFEFGSSGLAVRAFVPLTYNNEVIGTLQTGLDGQAVKSITDSLKGVQLSILDVDGVIQVASDDSKVGQTFKDQSVIDEVISGKEISNESQDFMDLYMPLYDPTKTEVIGVIQIQQDVAAVENINQEVFNYLLIIGISTLILVVLFAILLSRSFSRPIQHITAVMGEISTGNLRNELNGKKRNDEFGQLSDSVLVTQTNLKEMITRISELSGIVTEQSVFMKQACDEIYAGSNQVAMTIQDLASGSEQQATASSDIAERMDLFSRRVVQAKDTGTYVSNSSNEVLNITEDGNKLMNQSMKQMNLIHVIVKESVQKVEELDQQSKEISKLVSVIQNIADQTNLLALNAAIEAARAGEHGKGFAVVANEVRKLAEQVKRSISEITGIVENIQSDSSQVVESLTNGFEAVEEGTKQIKITGEGFGSINESIIDMVSNIQSISTNLSEIADNSSDINESIENIASISEESAAGIEEISASVQQTSSSIENLLSNAVSLEKLSEELQGLVKKFEI